MKSFKTKKLEIEKKKYIYITGDKIITAEVAVMILSPGNLKPQAVKKYTCTHYLEVSSHISLSTIL